MGLLKGLKLAIPKIIHQTWKTENIPGKFKPYQEKVRQLHPDWEYILWTDDEIDAYVKNEFPDFYPRFISFAKHIMRVDVIRYLIMYKLGGLYLDLDYEMIKPFDLNHFNIVLPKNRSINYGDKFNGIGNCIFASVPGHSFWQDVINNLQEEPPVVKHFLEVLDTTGPAYLTKIFYKKEYTDAHVPERELFHPPTPKNKNQYQSIINNGISYGIHHCSGTWREEHTLSHMVMKVKKIFSNK
ncbi:MAG: glycosyltransferase family 32 protein [Chitinophagales bacterium]